MDRHHQEGFKPIIESGTIERTFQRDFVDAYIKDAYIDKGSLDEPPPNECTPVEGSESPKVSNAETSTSIVHRGLQALARR